MMEPSPNQQDSQMISNQPSSQRSTSQKKAFQVIMLVFAMSGFLLALVFNIAVHLDWQSIRLSTNGIKYFFLFVFFLWIFSIRNHPTKKRELLWSRGNLNVFAALAPCPLWMRYVSLGTFIYMILCMNWETSNDYGLEAADQLAFSSGFMTFIWLEFAMFYAGYLNVTGRIRKSQKPHKPKPKRE